MRVDICHLRRTSFHSCTNITDVGMSAIADNCPLLNKINISWFKYITDIRVLAAVQNCPYLCYIYRSDCVSISYDILSTLRVSYLRLCIHR